MLEKVRNCHYKVIKGRKMRTNNNCMHLFSYICYSLLVYADMDSNFKVCELNHFFLFLISLLVMKVITLSYFTYNTIVLYILHLNDS
jgi:hypothetical protein